MGLTGSSGFNGAHPILSDSGCGEGAPQLRITVGLNEWSQPT